MIKMFIKAVKQAWHNFMRSSPSKRHCFECNEELIKEELFCGYCRRQ